MPEEGLFNEFTEVSSKVWKQKIQYELKGKDYNQELVWDSPEGIKVKPFYHADDFIGKERLMTKAPSLWKIGHNIYAGNAVMANKKALRLLGNGVEAIQFTIPSDKVDFPKLLNNIDIFTVHVYLNMQFLSYEYILAAKNCVQNSELLFFQVDIIGHLAKEGNWYTTLEKDHKILTLLKQIDIKNLFSVDMSLYDNAGADMVQQLAYGMAHANEYLNELDQKGSLKMIKSIEFKVAIGSNYFFEIAKLRALRILWKTLCKEYAILIDCHIIATPSKRNKTIYGYNVNMLRTTTECMSAILGGANTIFNIPYDSVYHKDNEFAERIALNQLLLLKEESYFDKVRNPADGSYFIDSITEQLAEKALVLFKAIEKNGGFLKQLKQNTIQSKIVESAKSQQERFLKQQDVLVGTNKFSTEDDRMGQSLELYPFVKKNPRKTLIVPIIEQRLAEELEQKRLKNE